MMSVLCILLRTTNPRPYLVKVVNNCYNDEVRDEVLVFARNNVLS